MSMYKIMLPNMFPYVAKMSESVIPEIARVLSQTRPGIPYGASFAVTSDITETEKRWVWLSQASYDIIKKELPELGFQVEVAL